MPADLPADLPADCPQFSQIFAYGAGGPAFDADYLTDDIGDSDDYVLQAMYEVASMLSISVGKQVSVAMTVEKLGADIQSDTVYKYLRQTLAGNVQVAKYVGELAICNYHKDNLTISDSGLIMYKGSRFLVPKVLRAGLLKALHCGHPGLLSMVLRVKETFWWTNLKEDIVQIRARCLLYHHNAPSQSKEPSMGVPSTNYGFESLSMDHFFLKGMEYLGIVNGHNGMLPVHSTNFKGSRELLRILRLYCQRN